MTTLKQVFLVSFWILLGAITLWGANRAGFLSPEHNSGSLTVLKVNFPEVYQVWKKKEAIFVDARSVSAFKHGHIPGAVNIPVNNVERGLSALPVDRRVRLITYCASVECPNSYQLMKTLRSFCVKKSG